MKFDLEVNEVNIILSALGQAPYAQVFEVVAKIQHQAKIYLDDGNQHQAQNQSEKEA